MNAPQTFALCLNSARDETLRDTMAREFAAHPANTAWDDMAAALKAGDFAAFDAAAARFWEVV